MHYRCHSLDLSCAGCHHPATHRQEGWRDRGTRLSLGFAQHGGAVAQQTAALKTPVRVLFRGQAEEEYEEDMRHPADGGSSDGARCCRCAVPGASFFVCVSDPRGWEGEGGGGVGLGKMEETRHPSHRRYRWWSGMLKGAVAGASPTGPWTDGRTGVRTPDHDERQPWRIPLDRPCLLPVWVQKLYSEKFGQACCAPPTPCVSSGTCVNIP